MAALPEQGAQQSFACTLPVRYAPMAGERDFYDILGVPRTATDDEIRSAFRKEARKHHPDVSTEPDAEKKFAELQEAYEVLSDTEKRASYDRFGRTGVGAGAPPGGGHRWGQAGAQVDPADFEDIFEQVFGGRGGAGGFRGGPQATPSAPRRGADIKHTITVTFQTAVLGGTEHLQLEGGASIDLRIPPGIADGGTLRLRGKGGPGMDGGAAGDVLVTVKVGSHPLLKRREQDLLVDVPISLSEAVLGVTVRVALLKGSVDVRIPAGTSSGSKLRVRGQGIQKSEQEVGDLIVTVQIMVPDAISDAMTQQFAAMAPALPDPRQYIAGLSTVDPEATD